MNLYSFRAKKVKKKWPQEFTGKKSKHGDGLYAPRRKKVKKNASGAHGEKKKMPKCSVSSPEKKRKRQNGAKPAWGQFFCQARKGKKNNIFWTAFFLLFLRSNKK